MDADRFRAGVESLIGEVLAELDELDLARVADPTW
jgi:hypothetical protein